MVSYQLSLLGITIFTLLIIYKVLTRKNIPNGLKNIPTFKGWPFVGLLFSISKPMYFYLFGLKQRFGSIFRFTLGYQDFIVLNDASIMNKTLKMQGTNFSGRWQNIVTEMCRMNSGLIFKDKEWWTVQRAFAMKVLRDFGLGKQRSQDIIFDECRLLLKEIEEIGGRPVGIKYLFPKYMLNVIAKLVINSRFEREDKDFKKMTILMEKLAHVDNLLITIVSVYPIIQYIPLLSRLIMKCSIVSTQYKEMHGFVKNIIDEHKKRFNPSHEGEDLIDMFLKEKYDLDSRNVKEHTFTDNQLIRVVTELFVAGFDTTASTLAWSMLFLSRYPAIQERVHKEIVDLVGTNRPPTIADKKSLNYTQAVMDEIHRRGSVVPLSLIHKVFEGTSVDDFYIPKDSVIIPNIYGVHHDKDTWKKPFQFYPEHFLTVTNCVSKYTPREELMPFSIGKRQCLGESLARMEFFMFLTSLLQKYRVRFPKNLSNDEFERIIVGTDGIIHAPLDTEIILELRQ